MNRHELEFRKELIKEMGAGWLVTIHTESDLNPGVPDLSYVMRVPGFETGWLELKSTPFEKQRDFLFHVEPGQHRWMRDHADKIPAHFLLASPERCWLLPGQFHHHLANRITREALDYYAHGFPRGTLRDSLHRLLRGVTNRRRDGI